VVCAFAVYRIFSRVMTMGLSSHHLETSAIPRFLLTLASSPSLSSTVMRL
jgi:hypothetical protein